LAVPRVVRAGPPETLDSHSADKAREDDSLCQKSELAIRETQTSNFQKRLDGVLLGILIQKELNPVKHWHQHINRIA
jgi:hypothetical protein